MGNLYLISVAGVKNILLFVISLVFFLSLVLTPNSVSAQASDTLFFENWESCSIGNWYASNGIWEVGVPTVGPSGTYSGQCCSGTVLDGNYFNSANTRLTSPQIMLPDLADGEKLKLKFLSWFRMNYNYADYDYGFVQISIDGGNNWETISGNYDEYSEVWAQSYVDISAYANLAVRIGFNFISSDSEVDDGWYIDDIRIEGIETPVDIDKSRAIKPTEFALSQNYPNPFNPTTNIRYSLPEAGNVKIDVYDNLGQKVTTLIDGYKAAGSYEIEFNGTGLSSGIYFYRLHAGDPSTRSGQGFIETKKIVFMK